MDLAKMLMDDIAQFKEKVERAVMVWCGSTETYGNLLKFIRASKLSKKKA
ncbi:MAG: hypothetical protein R2877_04180 [Bdellovibrionota bacterium]